MFAYVQNEIRMGTKSGYDTFMFVYTTHPLKAVFLKDSLTFQPWYGWNSADQTGLKLTKVPLPLCWNQRHVPPYLYSHCL